MRQAVKVLVIDDDVNRRHDLEVILDFLGEPVVCAGPDDWPRQVAAHSADSGEFLTVILAADARAKNLKARVQDLRDWDRACPVILAGSGEVGDDWEPYLRSAVIGRLSLPPRYGKLLDLLHRARLYREAETPAGRQQGGRPAHLFRSLVGSSRRIQDLRKDLARIPERDIPVLIFGEAGSGKEVVARNLHYQSARNQGPFVPLDCRTVARELLDAELFGHENSAFGGRQSPQPGRVEIARGGCLFLDGVSELPASTQLKLLRLLREKTYTRQGGKETLRSDVRVIAASDLNLEAKVQAGSFSRDLYYELATFTLDVPPLRERAEDVPLLINEVVSRLEGEKRGSVRFNSGAIMSLCRHRWMGNVRELAHLVERMALAHPYGVVGVSDLPTKYRHLDADEDGGQERATVEELTTGYQPTMVSMSDRMLLPESGINLKEYLSTLERSLIQQALADTGGIVARAAEHLAIRRTTLVEKMRKYGLQR